MWTLGGIAHVFGTVCLPTDRRTLMIVPGAFRGASRSGRPIALCLDHRRAVCDTRSGLRVRVTGRDVCWAVDPGTRAGLRAAAAALQYAKLRRCSIGIDILAEDRRVIDGRPVRVVTRAVLTEISLVRRPAFPGTRVLLNFRRPAVASLDD